MQQKLNFDGVKKRVLFVCVENSARSQMAEAWMNHLCAESFEAKSAGFERGTLNPLVVEAMQEVGIDISDNDTKSVFELFKQGAFFGYVIGVCDLATMEKCPIFPAPVMRLDWSFPDPAKFGGTEEEQLAEIRNLRDAIKMRIENWCAEMCVESTT